MKNKKGFTLIELLIVIAIIGLLGTLAFTALKGAQQKSRNTKRMANLRQLSKAVELYYNDNGSYPPGSGWDGYRCHDDGSTSFTSNFPDTELEPYITSWESLLDPTCYPSIGIQVIIWYYGNADGQGYLIAAPLEPNAENNDEEKNDGGYYCYLFEILGGDPIPGLTPEDCS